MRHFLAGCRTQLQHIVSTTALAVAYFLIRRLTCSIPYCLIQLFPWYVVACPAFFGTDGRFQKVHPNYDRYSGDGSKALQDNKSLIFFVLAPALSTSIPHCARLWRGTVAETLCFAGANSILRRSTPFVAAGLRIVSTSHRLFVETTEHPSNSIEPAR